MDGIAVHCAYRGQGIGNTLIDKIICHATDLGLKSIRLDVIDTNPKAQKLYEKKGFRAIKTEQFPYLKWLLGFSSNTTMQLQLNKQNKPHHPT
jgi:ribosomal protein S18 acetylase RimI-like enzyme